MLLLSTLALADVITPPMSGNAYIAHSVTIANAGDFPDHVFLAVPGAPGSEISGHRTVGAEPVELGRGGSNRPLGTPTIYAMTRADHEVWWAEQSAAIQTQREACERGEGCAHISRFVPVYTAPTALDCGIKVEMALEVPERKAKDVNEVYQVATLTDAGCALTKGTASSAPDAPASQAPASTESSGCSTVPRSTSLVGLLLVLLGAQFSRTRRA